MTLDKKKTISINSNKLRISNGFNLLKYDFVPVEKTSGACRMNSYTRSTRRMDWRSSGVSVQDTM